MKLLHSANQLVTPLTSGAFQVIEHAAIAGQNGLIEFVGSTEEALSRFPDADKYDLSGKVVLPGFVDAHTHLIHGGNRLKIGRASCRERV